MEPNSHVQKKLGEELKHGTQAGVEWDECGTLAGPSSSA